MGTDPTTSNVRAPGKLNIRLKVTGRRPDGYHELVSIMVPIGLYDHIEIKRSPTPGITLSCRGIDLPEDERNLVYRAARSFLSFTGSEQGLSISLTKNIPVAAGLGGGSSDAAFTLAALNRMWGHPLTVQDLADLAVRLGADVPFFLRGGPCIARGIGEILEPIRNWPKLWYVIVMPPFSVSTAWVYDNLKLKLTTGEYDSIISFLESGIFSLADILENDLESVTASRFPSITTIKKSLMAEGAEGALMSGSGPSVFGVFRSKDRALAAKRHLMSRNLGDLFAVEGVNQSCWGVVKW
jgi:4-diphosphocytidyl-2-C-methyl-D-erythritol kinase